MVFPHLKNYSRLKYVCTGQNENRLPDTVCGIQLDSTQSMETKPALSIAQHTSRQERGRSRTISRNTHNEHYSFQTENCFGIS